MENTTVSSLRSSLKNIFSETKDFAARTTIYGCSGALATRFISPLDWKSIGVMSTLNSACITVVQKFFGSQHFLSQALTTGAGMALSNLILAGGAVPLMGRIGLDISRKAAFQLLLFHAGAEGLKMSISRLYHHLTAPPKVPTTSYELLGMSKGDFDFICEHFEEYAPKMPLHQQEFLRALQTCFKENDSIIPTLPSSPKKVRELSVLDLFKIHAHYETLVDENSNQGVLGDLHHRFYQENLPFPEGDTVQGMKHMQKRFYYVYDIPLPQSVKEVTALKTNQLPWIFASINRRNFAALSLEVQLALKKRFHNSFHKNFLELMPSTSNLIGIPKYVVGYLQRHYRNNSEAFLQLPMDVKEALNAKFKARLGEAACLQVTLEAPKVGGFWPSLVQVLSQGSS